MAAGLILLLGGAALLLLAGGSKKGKQLKVGETPDQERALLTPSADGQWLMYRPEFRPMLTQRLKVMSVHESQAGDPQLQIMMDTGAVVPPESSAYVAIKAEHAMGYNIWVSPTLLSPVKQARWLYAAPAESPNPPAAWIGKLVLLVSSYDTPFPGDLSDTPPAPPPTPPPPPPGV